MRSMRSEAKPDPVPPKKKKKILNMIFPTSKRMEDEKSLEAVGLVRQSSYAVHCYL